MIYPFSPNTPGLRDWQHSSQLQELLTALVSARNELPLPNKPPLLLKLAPDLTQQERKDIAKVISRKEVNTANSTIVCLQR